MLQKREQAPKCGSNEEEKQFVIIYLPKNTLVVSLPDECTFIQDTIH
jgi:hypothetical protein